MERNNNSVVLKIILAIFGVAMIAVIATTFSPSGEDIPLPGGDGSTPAPSTSISSPEIGTRKTTKSPDQYLTATEMKDWAVVVDSFRFAIGANGKSYNQWLTDVQPLVTPTVYEQLSTVREENMVYGTPLGQPRGIRHGDNYVVFEDSWANPDSWEARYMVQKVGDKWLISSYQLNPNSAR